MPLIQKCAADLLASIGVDCDRVKDQTMPTISGRLLDYITKTSSKYTILGAHDTTGEYLVCFSSLKPGFQWAQCSQRYRQINLCDRTGLGSAHILTLSFCRTTQVRNSSEYCTMKFQSLLAVSFSSGTL